MLKTNIKYALFAVSIFALSACSHKPRTITIHNDDIRQTRQPTRIAHTRPIIQEEILLGQSSRNTSIGQRVDVPQNNPTIDSTIKSDENLTTASASTSHSGIIQRMQFPIEEYKYIKKRGRSTVSGRIFLENTDTDFEVMGKKVKLWLNPVTSYSRQWYEKSYLEGYKLSKTDKRLYNYLKFTYSDNSGNFNFFGVAAGDYYLTGTISCLDECGFNQRRSIRLVREISVGRNGKVNVDLTKRVP